ncbi:MAG: hypothetical protein KGP28_11700 [Bdellovibrionales bacterium]|nr:hypothetical protein [Bdellovibrionales bacterium]
MSSGVESPWAFFKNTFYRFCFGLGLATMSYYSFAGVKAWIDERSERSSKSSNGGFQEKVDSLTAGGAGTESSVRMTQFPLSLPSAIPLPSGAPKAQIAAGDAAVLPVNPDGQASLSPSPAATPDPALAAGAENAPNPENGEVLPNGGMEMPLPYAYPYAFDPGVNGGASGEESSASKKSDSQSSGNSLPAGLEPMSMVGAAVPGLFNNQNAGASNSQSAPNAPTQLLPSDLPFLTTGLQAVFASAPVGVNGGQASIHTSRWTPNEGLAPEVKFSIVGSNVNALTFQVGVNLQGTDGTYSLKSGVGSAVTVSARNEYRSAQLFRVFEFRLSNISVRAGAGEILRQVHVTLSFEAGSAANPVVGADSMISFVRTQVSMVPTPWNFNSPAASTDTPVIADQVNYSMPIERLP